MTLQHFCETHGLTLDYREWRGGYQCDIHCAETKESVFLTSNWAAGDTKHKAAAAFAKNIQGKLLVVDAMGAARREIEVPATLTVKNPKPKQTRKELKAEIVALRALLNAKEASIP